MKGRLLFFLLLINSTLQAQPPLTRTWMYEPYGPLTVAGGATHLVGGTNPADFTNAAGVSDIKDGVAYIPMHQSRGCD